jgi:serine/threonine protein phosphatase PrpC
MLTEVQISDILATECVPEAACRRLVAEANALGGKDNITAIVAHVKEP